MFITCFKHISGQINSIQLIKLIELNFFPKGPIGGGSGAILNEAGQKGKTLEASYSSFLWAEKHSCANHS
jgi:hypothetical protein